MATALLLNDSEKLSKFSNLEDRYPFSDEFIEQLLEKKYIHMDKSMYSSIASMMHEQDPLCEVNLFIFIY